MFVETTMEELVIQNFWDNDSCNSAEDNDPTIQIMSNAERKHYVVSFFKQRYEFLGRPGDRQDRLELAKMLEEVAGVLRYSKP